MFARIYVWIDTCLFIWFPHHCAAVCERDHYIIILEVPFLDTVRFQKKNERKGFIFIFYRCCCSYCRSVYVESIRKGMQWIFMWLYTCIKLSCILTVMPSCSLCVCSGAHSAHSLVSWWKLMMNQMSFGDVVVVLLRLLLALLLLFYFGLTLNSTITTTKRTSRQWRTTTIENKAQQHVFTCVLLHAFEHGRKRKNYFVILHSVIVRHRHTHTWYTLIADNNEWSNACSCYNTRCAARKNILKLHQKFI